MLLSTGANAGAANRLRLFSRAVAERGQPVEQDLRGEQPQERHAGAEPDVGLGRGVADQVDPEDERRGQQREQR